MAVVDLDNAEAYFDRVAKNFRGAAVKGLQSAAARAQQEIVVRIIPSRSPMPVDRGLFKAGWKILPTPDGADLYNDEPHAAFIEYGVRAENVKIGRQMIVALTAWVIRKGMASGQQEATSIAWAIAKRMQQRGIFRGGKGFGILKECVEKFLPNAIKEEVAREIGRL